MNSVPRAVFGTLTAVLGIVYARRSPERLAHSQRGILASAAIAVAAAYLAHLVYGRLGVPEALARMVCELALFVLAARWMWARPPLRYRVLKMVTALLLISILGDLALAVVGAVVPPAWAAARLGLGVAIYVSQCLGLANCLQYGRATTWPWGAALAAGYVAAVGILFELVRPLFAAFG